MRTKIGRQGGNPAQFIRSAISIRKFVDEPLNAAVAMITDIVDSGLIAVLLKEGACLCARPS